MLHSLTVTLLRNDTADCYGIAVRTMTRVSDATRSTACCRHVVDLSGAAGRLQLARGSAAPRDGDELLAVNGTPVSTLKHEAVLATLRAASSPLHLQLRRIMLAAPATTPARTRTPKLSSLSSPRLAPGAESIYDNIQALAAGLGALQMTDGPVASSPGQHYTAPATPPTVPPRALRHSSNAGRAPAHLYLEPRVAGCDTKKAQAPASLSTWTDPWAKRETAAPCSAPRVAAAVSAVKGRAITASAAAMALSQAVQSTSPSPLSPLGQPTRVELSWSADGAGGVCVAGPGADTVLARTVTRSLLDVGVLRSATSAISKHASSHTFLLEPPRAADAPPMLGLALSRACRTLLAQGYVAQAQAVGSDANRLMLVRPSTRHGRSAISGGKKR